MFSGFFVSILVLALFGGWLFHQQPAMIFFPSRSLVEIPADWGLQYEDTTLETVDGVRLHGWFIPQQEASRVLLFFHGNAGNISHRRESVMIFHRLGLNVFIFDYRGYGASQGKPSELGLYNDAMAAWQYLLQEKDFSRQQIIVFGRSLGGSVAVNLAAEVQPGALILESTFSSARDMANVVVPIISRIMPLRFEFNAVEHIKSVTSPVLVVHSTEDDIIPFRLGEKVYQAAGQPKSLVKIRGDHNSGFLLSQPTYEQALGKFLSTYP
ncbi:MAG: alpha/beta hydrolase [Gammaproteobacteria bacterium]|nr:alpha/beta hydrolase [Gammaproteobacteria bacterium]MCF6261295.1 alpha/beta hydrolase [Gammaproteobacteria bacterium]